LTPLTTLLSATQDSRGVNGVNGVNGVKQPSRESPSAAPATRDAARGGISSVDNDSHWIVLRMAVDVDLHCQSVCQD